MNIASLRSGISEGSSKALSEEAGKRTPPSALILSV
jgi:hypothetical protein